MRPAFAVCLALILAAAIVYVRHRRRVRRLARARLAKKRLRDQEAWRRRVR